MHGLAVVARRPYTVEVMKVIIPQPGPDDVVVDVKESFISNGTESSFIRGERIAGDTPIGVSDPFPFPMVPGYQKTGIVMEVGKNVKGINPGDEVFATISKVSNMFWDTGGHVSPAVTDKTQIIKLKKGEERLKFCSLVLTQVGYNCGMRPYIQKGDKVIVTGDGAVGHWAAQTLVHRGAQVIMLGKHDERLAAFNKEDIHRTINITGSNYKDYLEPDSISALIDTVGTVKMNEELYPYLKRNAHIVSAGFHKREGLIDIQKMRAKELTLHAPAGWTRDRLIRTKLLVEKDILDVKGLITHYFDISDAKKAYEMILEKKSPFLGVVLKWGENQ